MRKSGSNRKIALRVRVKKEQVEQRILDAAYRLFGKQGYEGTTLQDIAREVGLVKSGILYYFANKEEILLRVLEKHVGEFFSTLSGTNLKDMKMAEAGAYILEKSCDFLLRNPDFFRIYLPLRFGSAPAKVSRKLNRYFDTRYQEKWKETVGWEEEKVYWMLFMVWSIFLGICMSYLTRKDKKEVKLLEEKGKNAIRAIFR